MIVPCSQCHTRFKVPDHKVTARGVKVRCSRCGHTFRVFPEPSPPAGDPFAAFGPAGVSDLEKTPARGTQVAELLAKLDASPPAPAPAAEAGDDFDVDDSGEASALPEPAWSFPPAPAPRPSGGVAVVAATAAVRAAPSWEPEPPRAPIPVRAIPDPVPVAPAAAEGRADLAAFETQPERPPPPPPPQAQPPSFGSSADLASLAGFTPAWGVAAPIRALGADGALSNHHSRLEPSSTPEPILAPPLPPPPPMLGEAGTVLDDLPSLEDLGPPTGASLELDAHPDQGGWSGAPPLGDLGDPFEAPVGSSSVELDRSEPDPLAPSSSAAFDWDAPLAGDAATDTTPPPRAALYSAGSDFGDPFAEVMASATPAPAPSVPLDDAPSLDAPQDRGLFEMDRPGPPAPTVDAGPLLPDIPEAGEPTPGPGAPPPGAVSGPFPIGRLSRPPARARLGLDDRGEPGAARRVSAFVLNLGIAALLVVVVGALGSGYLSEGRMEWSMLSPRRWLAPVRSPSGVSPTDVTNGTYETRSGHALLYVRGRVLNHGEPGARIRVQAELWDGGKRVKTSDTLAGASASPEELWLAGTPSEVEALRQKLLAQAQGVPAGAGADFLVLFDEVPPELDSLRLRVLTSVDRR